jgi:hypothetical protein
MTAPVAELITTEQFLALPDEYDQCGNRIKQELIAGKIVSVELQPASHDLTKNRIGTAIVRFLASRRDVDFRALMEVAFAVRRTGLSSARRLRHQKVPPTRSGNSHPGGCPGDRH